MKDYQNLQKNYERLDNHYTLAQEDVRKFRTLYEQNDKELKNLNVTLTKIKEDKENKDLELKSNKDYIRKLENKLVSELRGQGHGSNTLADLLAQQKEQLNKVKKDKEHCEGLLENMYKKAQD